MAMQHASYCNKISDLYKVQIYFWILVISVIFGKGNCGDSIWVGTLETLPPHDGRSSEGLNEEVLLWKKLKERWHTNAYTRYSNYVEHLPIGIEKKYSFVILADILAGYLAGPFPKKIAMYNAKTYLPQYSRFYWIGNRYFLMDPVTQVASFLMCNYSLPTFIDVRYEDDKKVEQIMFQCVKFQGSCCELDCCDLNGRPFHSEVSASTFSCHALTTSHVTCLFALLLFFKFT